MKGDVFMRDDIKEYNAVENINGEWKIVAKVYDTLSGN